MHWSTIEHREHVIDFNYEVGSIHQGNKMFRWEADKLPRARFGRLAADAIDATLLQSLRKVLLRSVHHGSQLFPDAAL